MSTERKIALCYIRLSVTQDASDLTSPQRQRANIEAACEKYGWIPEWYEDAKGHKSATKEHNRPAWLALKARLRDPDVAALVVNEQSRAMRNAWRAIKLFEELPAYGVKLHLASADRTIDISTPDGRMSAYIQAFLDDLYALDASRRNKDSVKYRKGKGITIGIPPFGTIRGADGLLIPSPSGAWLLPDGSFQPGKDQNQPPHPDAIWRGYYDCAEQLLTLYKDNLHGYGWVADQLNAQGWAFRDRHNRPRPINGDDVRRVISNWREYAGLILTGRAKERIANEIENPSGILYDTGRAVFDIDLLREVARTQEARSVTTRPTGSVSQVYVFPLSFLCYCARCTAISAQEENPKLRARITGHNRNGNLRYRHADSHRCDSPTKSVSADELEGDFARLIQVLDVHPDAIELMAELAVGVGSGDDTESFESEKKVALAKHHRALKNNRTLFQSGEIEADEYYRQKDYHERQIVYWEAQTTDKQKIALELTTCVEMVSRLKQFWEVTDGEDRRLLAHSLFDEIDYDLEQRRIVDFKVKTWAEPFLILRAALYHDQMGDEMKNRFNSGVSRDGQFDDPNGCWNRTFTLPESRRASAA